MREAGGVADTLINGFLSWLQLRSFISFKMGKVACTTAISGFFFRCLGVGSPGLTPGGSPHYTSPLRVVPAITWTLAA